MIKLSLIIATDAQGGVSSLVRNESQNITDLERHEMINQPEALLASFKIAYEQLLKTIPSKSA